MNKAEYDAEAARRRVSAFMDGASLDIVDRQRALRELASDPQSRQAWLRYHQIGDAMRSPELQPLPDEEGFVQRLAQRLRDEPLPQAPAPARSALRAQVARRAWSAVGAAVAGLAAVTLVCYSVPVRRTHAWIAATGGVRTLPAAGGVVIPAQQVLGQWARDERAARREPHATLRARAAPRAPSAATPH
jgi:sigma-E factor negative regulatory protein RseA